MNETWELGWAYEYPRLGDRSYGEAGQGRARQGVSGAIGKQRDGFTSTLISVEFFNPLCFIGLHVNVNTTVHLVLVFFVFCLDLFDFPGIIRLRYVAGKTIYDKLAYKWTIVIAVSGLLQNERRIPRWQLGTLE